VVPHESFPEYCGAKAAVRGPRTSQIKANEPEVINFVRATARLLKTVWLERTVCCSLYADREQKENISINSVCPGIVPTTIIPQAMIDAVSPECLTPQSTIVSAYRLFLDDETLFGKTVECSAEKILFLETPSLANGHVSQRAVTVYEPLFETSVPFISVFGIVLTVLSYAQDAQGAFWTSGHSRMTRNRWQLG
jgi:NAD(P)-dependent dehydrogenase (short-subunit alcohol dehydrogenase family)